MKRKNEFFNGRGGGSPIPPEMLQVVFFVHTGLGVAAWSPNFGLSWGERRVLSKTNFDHFAGCTAILHWPFLKTLGPAPLSRTRPGRENGDACRARWPACAHVHVSVGCGRAIEPLPTGLHYTCTACSRPINRYRGKTQWNWSDDRRVNPALATGRCWSCSLCQRF